MRSIEPRTWFHAGAWVGLAATVYTNYRAAPEADLQVAYLVVPVLMAALSEGLIRTWAALSGLPRTLLTLLLLALVCVSYEHLRTLTLTAGGTEFAATIGSGVIDGAVFGCVLATASLAHSAPLRSAAPETLLVAPERSAPAEQSTPVLRSAPEPTPLSAPVAPVAELERSAPVLRTPLRTTDRSGELRSMAERFGQDTPKHSEVRALFACGDSKAARILREYREHLEQ